MCEENHAMDMKCMECDEVMCQKVARAHKRSKIGRDHNVIPLADVPPAPADATPSSSSASSEQQQEANRGSTEQTKEDEAAEAGQGKHDLSAFKAMMDAKAQNFRAGTAVPTASRMTRVQARTWGSNPTPGTA